MNNDTIKRDIQQLWGSIKLRRYLERKWWYWRLLNWLHA